MNVLLVGSGGREHALAWKLAQSESLHELHAAPGNPGIAELARCHPVAADDAEGLLALCGACAIDLVVVGPEAPLVVGVADALRRTGLSVFGPGAEAARIEGSKSFAKEVMRAAGVAAARALDEPRAPCVVKIDGLAAGKGVAVCETQAEADAAWARATSLAEHVLVEELLEGEEVSVFAVCDGSVAVPLPPARDAKRLRDGDEGPNTGGMGAYSPVLFFSDDEAADLCERVHVPVLTELARRGTPFRGLLYAGLMLTDDGPRVLEFNCRFGDPETQAILPRLAGDLLDPLARAASGSLAGVEIDVAETATAAVVLAAPGYPESPQTGVRLTGLDAAAAAGALVFQAGTALLDGELVSAGGRVLAVTGLASTTEEARRVAYEAVAEIDFPGAHYRRDIARGTVGVVG